jgi:hypothetical protein
VARGALLSSSALASCNAILKKVEHFRSLYTSKCTTFLRISLPLDSKAASPFSLLSTGTGRISAYLHPPRNVSRSLFFFYLLSLIISAYLHHGVSGVRFCVVDLCCVYKDAIDAKELRLDAKELRLDAKEVRKTWQKMSERHGKRGPKDMAKEVQ